MPKRLGSVSLLAVFSIWILYICQMAPSPLLVFVRDFYQIYNNDALLNMAVSIMFPAIIAASLIGGAFEQRIGARNLFTLSLLFAIVGLAVNFVAENYYVFLAGRLLYGIGFGISIPFIGSAIMNWYTGKQRYLMNTINGLFPFIGAVVAFGVMVPVYTLLNNSLKLSFGVWSIPLTAMLLIWNLLFDKDKSPLSLGQEAASQERAKPKSLYRDLLKRKNIQLLCIIFICDFLCYSYISVILPTYLCELSGISESQAGLLSAIAFPAVGVLGASAGGMLISKTGLRKPAIAAGQLLKLLGGVTAALGSSVSLAMVICGVALFGIGNSLWMPSMYTVPTELENMNSTNVAASFSLISSCGFAAGFIGPIIGGWLTNRLMQISGIIDPVSCHVFGLRWCLFIYSFVNLLAFFCTLRMTETGPGTIKVDRA